MIEEKDREALKKLALLAQALIDYSIKSHVHGGNPVRRRQEAPVDGRIGFCGRA